MDDELRKALLRSFPDRENIEILLTPFGYPLERLPTGTNAELIWNQVIYNLENGIVDRPIEELIAMAADRFPGHPVFKAYRAERSKPDDRQGTSITVPQVSNYQETIALVRDVAGEQGITDIEPAFTSDDQLCFHLPPDLTLARRLAQAIGERLASLGRNNGVQAAPFRDYMLSRLIVEGPDQGRFELVDVPASARTGDVGGEVLEQGYEDGTMPTDGTGQRRPHTVDHIGPNGEARRLDPDKSLHENGVQDGDSLAVAPESTAGSLNPIFRNEALVRTRLQIERFSRTRPEFKVKANARQRPTFYQFDFSAAGWGPPQPGQKPYPQDKHRVAMELRPEFPLQAPLVVWRSPIFHPNVDPDKHIVCLGALMEGYRPAMDLGVLCQMLLDMAAYRNYDLSNYLNQEAQAWAISDEGQIAIEQRGGLCLIHRLMQQHHQHRRFKLRRL